MITGRKIVRAENDLMFEAYRKTIVEDFEGDFDSGEVGIDGDQFDGEGFGSSDETSKVEELIEMLPGLDQDLIARLYELATEGGVDGENRFEGDGFDVDEDY